MKVEPAVQTALATLYRVQGLIAAGRADDALTLATRPSGTAPADLALWHARGQAAFAAGEFDASIEAWRVMVAARPDDWRAWANLGNVLGLVEHWGDAADALRRAVALNPAEAALVPVLASALLHHAQAQSALGRHQDALSAVDEAMGLVGDGSCGSTGGPAALELVASLLERTGRWEALARLVSDSGARGFELPRASAILALRAGEPAEARRLLALDRTESDPVGRHRLLGRIADALGDAAVAFAEYAAMNRATPGYESWRQRGASFRHRLRTAAESWTPELGRKLCPAGRASPVFLVGFPRSGTTLLDTFLMGHPDVTVVEEMELVGPAKAVREDLAGLAGRSTGELLGARDSYFETLDAAAGPEVRGLIIDKLPLNMVALPFIRALFPDARIIFAQRHPCDAVLSGFMQSFVLNEAMASFLDIHDSADLFDAAMLAFSRARDALPLQIHPIRYERLVSDPRAALEPLIAWLELGWTDAMLDHRATARRRGAITTPSYDQVVEPLSTASNGRWRRYEAQLAPVLPTLLPWAERLGYPD